MLQQKRLPLSQLTSYIMFFSKKVALLALFFFIFNATLFSFNSAIAVEKNDPSVMFLTSIKDMIADYQQEQYENGKRVITNGKIVVQKPDKIMLTHNSKQMKLKIVSINGNVKMIDEDLKQTTYIDNKYSELMQFFTKNLKPERLKKNNQGDLCMSFRHLDNNFDACLKMDLQKQTLNNISVFTEDQSSASTDKQQKTMFQIMNITFQNVKINQGIDKKIFFIKDTRIFDDEDEI